MNVAEICPLTEGAVNELLEDRSGGPRERRAQARRRVKRWPFPGTVEMWLPDENGGERAACGQHRVPFGLMSA